MEGLINIKNGSYESEGRLQANQRDCPKQCNRKKNFNLGFRWLAAIRLHVP